MHDSANLKIAAVILFYSCKKMAINEDPIEEHFINDIEEIEGAQN